MQAMTTFEKKIMRDIHGLPPAFQEKIANLVYLVKKEFVPVSVAKDSATEEFLAVCGKWKDTRTVEEQLDDLYDSRRSTERTEHLF
ncbi:MAG TPA: hypothetical protein HPP97_01980 [Desulfuromonadales bacterium]|nr:hypothetical protein [Desulfuromonadales bacterium]